MLHNQRPLVARGQVRGDKLRGRVSTTVMPATSIHQVPLKYEEAVRLVSGPYVARIIFRVQ